MNPGGLFETWGSSPTVFELNYELAERNLDDARASMVALLVEQGAALDGRQVTPPCAAPDCVQLRVDTDDGHRLDVRVRGQNWQPPSMPRLIVDVTVRG